MVYFRGSISFLLRKGGFFIGKYERDSSVNSSVKIYAWIYTHFFINRGRFSPTHKASHLTEGESCPGWFRQERWHRTYSWCPPALRPACRCRSGRPRHRRRKRRLRRGGSGYGETTEYIFEYIFQDKPSIKICRICFCDLIIYTRRDDYSNVYR